jgi:hypothetical protein
MKQVLHSDLFLWINIWKCGGVLLSLIYRGSDEWNGEREGSGRTSHERRMSFIRFTLP